VHDGFQSGAFPPEVLCSFRVVPDFRIFQFAKNLGQAFLLGFEVKDTP
jgi:hypothetical protein